MAAKMPFVEAMSTTPALTTGDERMAAPMQDDRARVNILLPLPVAAPSLLRSPRNRGQSPRTTGTDVDRVCDLPAIPHSPGLEVLFADGVLAVPQALSRQRQRREPMLC